LGIYADAAAPGEIPAAEATGLVDIRRLMQVVDADETDIRVAVSMLERADLLTRGFDVPKDLTVTLSKTSSAAPRDAGLARLLRGLDLKPGETAEFKNKAIADYMGWQIHEVEPKLLDWQSTGHLRVKGSHRAMHIELPPRPPDMADRLRRILEPAAVFAQRRIDDVVGYATTDRCRHGYISTHFGSPPRSHCDVCDNCTGVRPDLPTFEAVSPELPDDADIESMILDCLISLPKPVGRGGLARILAGSLRAPATPDKARHHGRLKALGEVAILGYIDDLLEDGRLRQYERRGYPVLAPTVRGRAEAEAWLAVHPELATLGPAPEPDPAAAPEEELAAEGDKYTALQKAIWLWRRRSAEEQKQPPYMIMSNELILRIAEERPQTLEELAVLPGMGAQRLEHYGPTLLDLIHLYPPQPGDAELLAAQRAAPRPQVQPPAAPKVSPQVERRILLRLQELRQRQAVATRAKPHLVASNPLLKAIAQAAPTTLAELEQIRGFRESGLAGDADRILASILEARNATPTH
jgi:ATP-dependent DNA helicase RecQ